MLCNACRILFEICPLPAAVPGQTVRPRGSPGCRPRQRLGCGGAGGAAQKCLLNFLSAPFDASTCSIKARNASREMAAWSDTICSTRPRSASGLSPVVVRKNIAACSLPARRAAGRCPLVRAAPLGQHARHEGQQVFQRVEMGGLPGHHMLDTALQATRRHLGRRQELHHTRAFGRQPPLVLAFRLHLPSHLCYARTVPRFLC
jgi:hypothetical protein